ncbi:hypothetical protein LY632_10330 [Erythrobacter sp. SDW2]|uniref:hypothetical protein n=1 Tax=Erythrobacter sp. SDW2 TaxID=2907154 RepID=UPI001F2ED145|nr:hypothetical protein [Erythrobacter sp. SDW2]UIP06093.1 hypothetical protein LY632_10330 [Erythrobacter sp. SDW2]
MSTITIAKSRRRSLVLTDEGARHPFLVSLPPHVRSEAPDKPLRAAWVVTREDIRGFASAYFASLAAALVFLL